MKHINPKKKDLKFSFTKEDDKLGDFEKTKKVKYAIKILSNAILEEAKDRTHIWALASMVYSSLSYRLAFDSLFRRKEK